MKLIKKIAAVILVFVMALTVIGCHPQNEIAVTIGDCEFSSAYYMCALINAYIEGQNEVGASLSTEESQVADINYFEKEIDEKSFETWVKDRAIEILKEIAFYKTICKENNLKLDEETLATSEYLASSLWTSFKDLFEPNGVSQQTFTTYLSEGGASVIADMYLSYMGTITDYKEIYFQHLYGKGGEKEISKKDLEKELYSNYVLAQLVEVNFEEQETDAQRKKVKEQFEEYESKLKKGKMTFEEVYKDYNKTEEGLKAEKDGPKDPYALLLDSTSTEYYSKIRKMDVDDIKLFENSYKTNYTLVVKKDLEEDDYYLKALDSTLRHTIKDSEFDKEMSAKIAKVEVTINDYAVDRFEVDEIIEPDYSEAY